MDQTCPFCRTNHLLATPILAETEGAYLVPAWSSKGNYLIIPEAHIESPLDLPDDWWKAVKALLPRVPGPLEQYNITLNVGRTAGQTVKHLHFWIIPRVAGQPAAGKGLALLISEANATAG